MSGKRGEVNGWTCDRCGGVTMAIHVDDGVTPMFLTCRANGIEPEAAMRTESPIGLCTGRAVSMMYPAAPLPDGYRAILIEFGWEWYRPEGAPTLEEIEAGFVGRRRRPKRLRGICGGKPFSIDGGTEYARLRDVDREHVDKGGLLLRRLTDAGRELIPGRATDGGA